MAVPPDLITVQYAYDLLAILALTPAQLSAVPAIITAASNAIQSWCNRTFAQATYVEECPVELNGTIRLKNPPINQILRVQAQPTQAMTVQNPSTSVQNARCYLTVTGDAVAGQAVTGLTLVSVSSGVATTTPIVFTANETIASLATAINLVSGWVAVADPVLGLWPVTEMIEGLIAQGTGNADQGAVFNVYGVDLDGVRFHPDDGQLTGIVWTGQQYGGLGPRWGPDWQQWDDVAQASWGRCKVTYNGGFATIPAQIQLACVEFIQNELYRLKLDPTLISEAGGQYSYTINPRWLTFLSMESVRTISAYRIHNA